MVRTPRTRRDARHGNTRVDTDRNAARGALPTVESGPAVGDPRACIDVTGSAWAAEQSAAIATGRRRAGAADRVRQRGEFVAGTRGRPHSRDGDPAGTRRGAMGAGT